MKARFFLLIINPKARKQTMTKAILNIIGSESENNFLEYLAKSKASEANLRKAIADYIENNPENNLAFVLEVDRLTVQNVLDYVYQSRILSI